MHKPTFPALTCIEPLSNEDDCMHQSALFNRSFSIAALDP